MSNWMLELFNDMFGFWLEILIETGLMDLLIFTTCACLIVFFAYIIICLLWYLYQRKQNKQYQHALFMHKVNKRQNR